MKALLISLILSLTAWNANAQEANTETGFSGDHFSLEGAIEVFKNAKTIEGFEEDINSEDSNVNNLDLNEDGEIDYIRVIDNTDGEVHAIVLQAVLGENESQDIAVIEIEQNGQESASLQIVGDEEIYGSQLIVEPFVEEVQSGEDQKGGPSGEDFYAVRLVVNVWFYPSVQHIYRPNYRIWVSPYRWRTYPRNWKPWRPIQWNVFHPRTRVWNRNYHVVKTHRHVRARSVYTPRRTTSVTVRRRTTVVRSNRKAKVTRTRTTKLQKNNNKTVKKTTVKKTRNGKTKVKTTSKKKRRGN